MFLFLLLSCAGYIQEDCALDILFYDSDGLEYETKITIGAICFESENERVSILNEACSDAISSLEDEGFVDVNCEWECMLLKEGFAASSECLGI